MAEDDEQRQEDNDEHSQRYPIGDRAEEEIVDAMKVGIASMNVADIATQLLDILLTSKRSHRGLTVALSNLQRKGLSTDCLVAIALRIEIGIFDGRNLIRTLMTRHSKEVVDNATLQTIDC